MLQNGLWEMHSFNRVFVCKLLKSIARGPKQKDVIVSYILYFHIVAFLHPLMFYLVTFVAWIVAPLLNANMFLKKLLNCTSSIAFTLLCALWSK